MSVTDTKISASRPLSKQAIWVMASAGYAGASLAVLLYFVVTLVPEHYATGRSQLPTPQLLGTSFLVLSSMAFTYYATRRRSKPNKRDQTTEEK